MDVIDGIQLIQKEYDDQQMISKMMEMGTNAYIRKLPTPRKFKPKKIKNAIFIIVILVNLMQIIIRLIY